MSFRFTPTFQDLLDQLAKREGLTKTGYLETTIRRMAKEEGIQVREVQEAARA